MLAVQLNILGHEKRDAVMDLSGRYVRNMPALSADEQKTLAAARAVIIGCGGLGGHIALMLARIGVGSLTVVDGDVFAVSDLNRQRLASATSIGCGKADVCREVIANVNASISVRAMPVMLDEQNADDILRGHDIAVDALDTAEAKILLEDACDRASIPLVHGAITGWSLQVAVVRPGSRILHSIYAGSERASLSNTSLSFTPAMCASIQAAEAVKILVGHASPIDGRLLIGDLARMEFDTIELSH